MAEPLSAGLKARLMELRASGFNRLYQDGQIYEFSTPESLLDLDFSLPVFVLLDRIVIDAENRARKRIRQRTLQAVRRCAAILQRPPLLLRRHH